MKISVSLLSSYLFCSRKLFLEQVLGLKALPKGVTIKGTIKHNVLDLVNKQEKGIVSSTDEQNLEEIKEKYKFLPDDLALRYVRNYGTMTRKILKNVRPWLGK